MSAPIVRFAGFGLALVFASAFASAANADDTITKRLWLASGTGRVVTVDSFREMRDDCSLAPAPDVVVTQQPAFGKLTVSKVKAPGKTDPAGPYAACNGKPFNWTVVKVPSPAKAEGTDGAVLRATETSGEVTTYDIEIVFAKKLPAGKSSGLLEDR